MSLWLKEDVEALKEKQRVARRRLKVCEANLGPNAADSATAQALKIELNRLENALAAAESDFTPNPPGAAPAARVAGHKE